MRIPAGLALAACVAASACAPKASRVVLVPDRDGHVGVVSVANAQGSVVLDQAQAGVTIANARSAPSQPAPVSPETIQAIFGEALAVEPAAPEVCIVYFATGSAEIEAEGRQALDVAVAAIARRGSVDVSVDGHTDTAGDPAVNMRLSLARAQAVRDRLVSAGVPAGIITVRYHGKGVLLVPTGDNVDEPKNRRVEVVVR